MNEQYDSRLFSEFFDWQPQPFVWLQPIWDHDGSAIIDFEYAYSNEPGLEYLKLARGMLGKIRVSDTPSLNDEMRPRVFQEMLEAYLTGKTVVVDLYNPVIDKYGTVYRMKFRDGVLVTIQGKTEERRAINDLNKRTKELQQFNDSLREFTYVASHDLQEPLRKIRSFADILKKELPPLNEAQQSIFNRIESSIVRMKQLIDDLLAYSLVTVRQEILVSVNLQHVVREVLQDLERAISEAGIVVSIEALPKLKADPSQMRQLFQNLISNAVKYHTREETPTVSIQSKILEYDDPLLSKFPGLESRRYCLIEVTDNGIGFDQQYEEKIFQVFQRLHGRSAYEGTGIGLAIVQKVVLNHHGFIKAISSPGKGATFQVLLPMG